MSIIKEIVKKQTGQNLTEALRFGNKEMAAVFQNQSKFRVGLEFEFEVTEGIDFVTAIEMGDGYGPKLKEYRSKVAGYVNKLSGFVIKAISLDLDDIGMIASDFQTASPDDVEYLLDLNMDEAINAFSVFFNCVANSLTLAKFEHTEDLVGFGLWSGDVRDPVIGKIKLVQANRNRYMDMSEQEQLTFAKTIGGVLDAFIDYVENDCESVSRNLTPDKLHQGMLNIIEQSFAENNPEETQGGQRSKVDVVKDTHPLDPSLVQSIVPDITVLEGAELVTKPLMISDVHPVLKQMSSYIKNIGGTSQKTGLHVNISIKNMDKVNPAKFITLIDADFFQNMSPTGYDKFKYEPRYMVQPFVNVLNANADRLAAIYVNKGQDAFFQEYESVINSAASKERSINLMNFFSRDVKTTERRIEIRALGGKGYENRTDEIYNDILHFLYVLMVATNEDFERRKYRETIVRWLNQVTNGRFLDMIQSYRRKMS